MPTILRSVAAAAFAFTAPLACDAAAPPPAEPRAGEATIRDQPVTHAPTDWPGWMGPTANLVAPPDADPPVEWSDTANIAWQRPVPGRGHASPVVVGDSVIIATSDDADPSQSIICYNRADGAIRWSTKVHDVVFAASNRKNSHASATPVTDGRFVYAVFLNAAGLYATKLDLADGSIVWKKELGEFSSEHGYGASPLIHRSALLISGEDRQGGFLAAVDRDTGDRVWTTPRKTPGVHGNYASIALGSVAGRPQMVIHGFDHTASFDPDTGRELWRIQGPAEVCANTPTLGPDTVYIAGGFPRQSLVAIAADGAGDVTESHVKWTDTKATAYVPSMVLRADRLYVVDDQGIATCYNVKAPDDASRVVWRQRLGGDHTASPVLVGDRLYVSSETGVTRVLSAGDEFKIIAENKLPAGIYATPAVSGDTLFVRTLDTLYCIRKPR